MFAMDFTVRGKVSKSWIFYLLIKSLVSLTTHEIADESPGGGMTIRSVCSRARRIKEVRSHGSCQGYISCGQIVELEEHRTSDPGGGVGVRVHNPVWSVVFALLQANRGA